MNMQNTPNIQIFIRLQESRILNSAEKCKKEKLSDNATFEELGFDSLDQMWALKILYKQIKTDQDAMSLFNKLQQQIIIPPQVEENPKK
ncbi:hypothetical protein pb186bvf_019848 [Paramecium bursaria]